MRIFVKVFATGCSLLVGLLLTSQPLMAGSIEIGYPIPSTDGTDSVPARGEYITALSTFTISSFGFKGGTFTAGLLGSPITATANIYAATGVTRGALLATAAASFTDTGAMFHDVPISFNFVSGTNYDLEMVLNVPVNITFFSPGVTEVPVNIGGLLTLVQSETGGTFHSGLYRDYRLGTPDAVPEPSTLISLSIGLLVLMARRFRSDTRHIRHF
jgi:hypothetical protein